MTLEEALITLGSRPLSRSPYSQAIQAIVMATVGQPITKDTAGYEILGFIYQIGDLEKREQLLNRKIAIVRNTDLYKQVVVGSAALLVIIAVAISSIEVLSDTPVSGDYADVFKTIVVGLFDIIKIILTDTTATPS